MFEPGKYDRLFGAGGGDDAGGPAGCPRSHYHEYHLGCLARDREFDPVLHRHAGQLYRRAARGEIELFQWRVGANKFSYCFVWPRT